MLPTDPVCTQFIIRKTFSSKPRGNMSIPVSRCLWLVVGIIVLCGVRPTDARDPGVKLRLTQSGLDYAAQLIVDELASRIQSNLTLADVSGIWNALSYANVNYSFTKIKVLNIKKPNSSVTLDPISGIKWSLTDASITVAGSWNYAYKLPIGRLSDTGSFTATAKGISLTIGLLLTTSGSGQPSINVTACRCVLGDISVTFGSGAPWLNSLFESRIALPLKVNIRPEICNAVNKAIGTNANQELATMQPVIPFFGRYRFDYSLVSDPLLVAGSFVETWHTGEMYYQGDATRAPFQPPANMSDFPNTSSMMVLQVSEYVFNTIGYIMFRRSVFVLDKNMGNERILTPNEPANTTVDMHIEATTTPTVSIRNNSMKISFQTTTTMTARLQIGSTKPILTAEVNATFVVTPTFNGSALSCTLSNHVVSVLITDNRIDLADNSLRTLFNNYYISKYVRPLLNEVGVRGFPLPHVDYARFVNAAVLLQDGVMSLLADVQ